MNKSNPFINLKLNSQEQRLEKALGKGEFVRASNLSKTKKLFRRGSKKLFSFTKNSSLLTTSPIVLFKFLLPKRSDTYNMPTILSLLSL